LRLGNHQITCEIRYGKGSEAKRKRKRTNASLSRGTIVQRSEGDTRWLQVLPQEILDLHFHLTQIRLQSITADENIGRAMLPLPKCCFPTEEVTFDSLPLRFVVIPPWKGSQSQMQMLDNLDLSTIPLTILPLDLPRQHP
jgi:hypothetical protein